MAQTAAPASTGTGFLDKHHFLLRRLHSLSGIIPVGVFVIFHLFTNFQMSSAMFGVESTFQHEVDFIHDMPALLIIEITLWASIAFHAILGVAYMTGYVPNHFAYRYGDNWRYTMQRVTAWISLVFIFVHIATLRWGWDFFGWFTPFYARGVDGEPLAMATTANALQAHWLVVVLYLVGALAVVYHWANGLWTAAISWGLTLSVAAQKRWGYVCAAMGIVLTVFTLGAIGGALMYDVSDAERASIERAIEEGARHGEDDSQTTEPADAAPAGQGASSDASEAMPHGDPSALEPEERTARRGPLVRPEPISTH